MLRLGIEGRLVLAFTMAGGVLLSGVLVATTTLAGGSAGAVFSTTLLLFIIGSALGWVHAVVLGCAAREEACTRIDVLKRILAGGLWALPALAIALLAAMGMAVSPIVMRVGGAAGVVAAAVSWTVGGAICLWALAVGLEGFRNAAARYSELRAGTLLLGVLLLALIIVFQMSHPEIWGTNYRVNAIGAVILAYAATIWIGAPILFSTLHLLFRRPRAPWPSA